MFCHALHVVVMNNAPAVVQGAVPRPPSDTVQIALRVPTPWQTEADQLAKLLSRPGINASRSDAYRAAMARGFEVLRAELEAQVLKDGAEGKLLAKRKPSR